MDFTNVGVGLAFLAGIASFLSPCVFSLVPAYIGYLGGRTAASAAGGRESRWIALTHGIAFVLGFSLVFILIGLGASALGGLLYNLQSWLARIGGIVVIIFGLHMTGIIRIRFLEYDLRPQTVPDRNRGYLASFLMGIFFSAGWSPCIGPILGAILTLALYQGSISQGMTLLTAYSIGFAIPFLVAAMSIGWVTNLLRNQGKTIYYLEKVMGVILIIVGVLLFTGRFETLASLGSFLGVYDELVVGRWILIALVGLAILGLIPGYIATRKGRNFIDWWLFGVFLFPIALPMALLIKPGSSKQEPATHAQQGKG
jgi:cytochrome c-type biogenesis protein